MKTTIDRVREFNRSWTEVLGLLDRSLLDTDHSLAEARILFELSRRDGWERSTLKQRLGMDASFLTRVISRLQKKGLVSARPSLSDGRALDLALTAAGRAAFVDLNRRSNAQIEALVAPLSPEQRSCVTEAMTLVSHLLRPDAQERRVEIRDLRPGDMGWVIQRHGAIYADEFGWNRDFEALVATIVANYHTEHRPARENAWIATVDGARAGCIFCCEKEGTTAQLRILLVEPWARGVGLGTQLVSQCIAFATDAGYSTLTLWTNDVLVSARRIYEAAGFALTEEAPHHSFGHDLVGQIWTLELPIDEERVA